MSGWTGITGNIITVILTWRWRPLRCPASRNPNSTKSYDAAVYSVSMHS